MKGEAVNVLSGMVQFALVLIVADEPSQSVNYVRKSPVAFCKVIR